MEIVDESWAESFFLFLNLNYLINQGLLTPQLHMNERLTACTPLDPPHPPGIFDILLMIVQYISIIGYKDYILPTIIIIISERLVLTHSK